MSDAEPHSEISCWSVSEGQRSLLAVNKGDRETPVRPDFSTLAKVLWHRKKSEGEG